MLRTGHLHSLSPARPLALLRVNHSFLGTLLRHSIRTTRRLSVLNSSNFSLVDQQFAFTGWAFPARRDNDSLHRGVDNLLSADRTCKRVIEELEFDRAHGKIVAKK